MRPLTALSSDTRVETSSFRFFRFAFYELNTSSVSSPRGNPVTDARAIVHPKPTRRTKTVSKVRRELKLLMAVKALELDSITIQLINVDIGLKKGRRSRLGSPATRAQQTTEWAVQRADVRYNHSQRLEHWTLPPPEGFTDSPPLMSQGFDTSADRRSVNAPLTQRLCLSGQQARRWSHELMATVEQRQKDVGVADTGQCDELTGIGTTTACRKDPRHVYPVSFLRCLLIVVIVLTGTNDTDSRRLSTCVLYQLGTS
jgi:hypothetical protein